jgi:hypothetical protein
MLSMHDPVTLFPAAQASKFGWAEVSDAFGRVASMYSNRTRVEFEAWLPESAAPRRLPRRRPRAARPSPRKSPSIIAAHVLASGFPQNAGFEIAFLIGAVGAIVAAMSVLLIPGRRREPPPTCSQLPRAPDQELSRRPSETRRQRP